MSFRARLTTFFVLIVVIPMTAMGLLVFGLINRSATSKAQSRAAGISVTAASVYRSSSLDASLDARTIARDLARVPSTGLRAEARRLLAQGGLARIEVRGADGAALSVGSPAAVAPGIAVVRASAGRPQFTVAVSQLTAGQFSRRLAGPGSAIVVRSADATIGASLPGAVGAMPSLRGAVRIGGVEYEAITETFSGFSGARVSVTSLSARSATAGSVSDDRALAGAFIVGFLLLAFFFTLLVSRSLQAQVAHFLEAARRLGGGDFSSPVPTVGNDEFAQLGSQFNAMSEQLRDRLEDLEQERARFRASIRRIGEAFASGLDRDALLEIALRTAIDAVQADRGRLSARARAADPLIDTDHVGSLAGLQTPMLEAERAAVQHGIATAAGGEAHVAAVALGAMPDGGPTHGVITVCREGRPFTADDLELLRSLAARATLALANADMHVDVARQAVTDDLTGLASHGHFQEQLTAECNESARYDHPVAVAMFDIDNFKSVNDTYGHPQGDLVLQRVANVLRETCRQADLPARYGGEEMVLVLPHTDLDGAREIAERARVAIERTAVPRLDHQGWLKVTASVGVAAGVGVAKEALVGAADSALYAAKRAGKNRTVHADPTVRSGDGARQLARSASAGDGE